MAYIGKEPAVGNFQVCDAISVVNGQAAYTMQVSSTNVVPESANHMLVSLNGILQKPNSSFTVSGSTITFASNLATGDVIDFIMLLGSVLNIGTPSDSTVTNAKTNFVTTSSAAGLQIKGDGSTAGALQLNCEQNSHGIQLQSPPHSANQSYTLKFPSGNVTAGKFLKVDSVSGSGTTGVGTMTFASAGGITEIDTYRLTSDLTSSNWTLDANLERADHQTFSKLGTGMTESSGIFTFPSTGFYLVQYHQNVTSNADRRAVYAKIMTTHDNGTYVEHYTSDSVARVESNYTATMASVAVVVDVTDTTNIKVKFGGSSTGSCIVSGNTNANTTYMTFIRLGDT